MDVIPEFYGLFPTEHTYAGSNRRSSPSLELTNVVSHNLAQSHIDEKFTSPQLEKAISYTTQLRPGKATVKLGEAVSGGYDRKAESWVGFARYCIGGAIQVIGNCIEGITEIVQNNLLVGAYAVKNLGEFAIDSALSKQAVYGPQRPQERLPEEKKQQVLSYAQLIRATQTKGEIETPDGYAPATESDIPTDLLARGVGKGTGSVLTMRIENREDRLVLQSDPLLSALHVGVFLRKNDDPHAKPQIVLCFDGTATSRLGTYVSDMAAAVGINTSAARESTKLVKAFVKRYGAENVTVAGYSLGGNLAANAALRNSSAQHQIQGFVFNALGLTTGQRFKLGDKVELESVINVNTAGDPLSQIVPTIAPVAQAGTRYLIDNSEKFGHGMKHLVEALKQEVKTPQQKTTGAPFDITSVIPAYFYP